jgi:hypothetical protein
MNSGFDPSDIEQKASESQDYREDQREGQAEMPLETPERQSRMISKVLAPAVKFWLRSQVDHIEDLHLDIEAGDRQILSGHIRQVALSAQKAIYQGLHLTQVNLFGQNIRVNLGQVVRGKPLKILEPIPIEGTLMLQEADLSASVNAPLLKAGVTEFLVTLLRSSGSEVEETKLDLQNLKIRLEENQVVLAASLISVSGNESAIAIRSGFEMDTLNILKLVNPQWLPHANAKRGLAIEDLDGYQFKLGEDTEIHDLKLEAGQITCRAKLLVRP